MRVSEGKRLREANSNPRQCAERRRLNSTASQAVCQGKQRHKGVKISRNKDRVLIKNSKTFGQVHWPSCTSNTIEQLYDGSRGEASRDDLS